jgi:hypothetical protein
MALVGMNEELLEHFRFSLDQENQNVQESATSNDATL